MNAFRGLAFGDSAGDLWGVAWTPAGTARTALAVRAQSGEHSPEVELTHADPGDGWRLEGEGVSLLMAPTGAAGHGSAVHAELESTDEVCVVSGEIKLEGVRHEIACLGWCNVVKATLEFEGISSFRQASAWFEPPRGLSLLALRPRRAGGQDSDLVVATLLDPEPGAGVSDPRLSTTYDAHGRPKRAGLELWLEPESTGPDSDPEQAAPPVPRRVTGQSLGPGVSWSVHDFTLSATLLRWYSRGQEGTGVYLLGERG